MRTRAELEAALAKAEADWRRASERLDQRQAERGEANEEWSRLSADRRGGGGDRRSGTGDRRKSEADRRSAEIALDRADDAWEQAVQARREAREAWNQARAALEELDRTGTRS